jgi:ABC-2 type transport system permease protein
MNKIAIIAKREYMYHLRRPSFLFAAFGIPIFIVIIFALSIAVAVNSEDEVNTESEIKYGYVDYSGVLLDDVVREQDSNDLFVRYEDEAIAREKLDAGDINAYFVMAEDYMASGKVNLYSEDGVPEDLYWYINNLLIANISSQIEEIDIPAYRISNPVDLTVRLNDSGRELTDDAFIPLLIMPIIFAVVFVMASQITGSFLMTGLVEEKTNRVMEILITSITPMQLLSGKVIGLGLLGLTQLAVWLVVAVIVITFGADIGFMANVTLPIDLVIIAIVYFILGYALTAVIMAGIGAVVGSEQESRQIAGIVSVVFAIPYFFMLAFMMDPNGTVPVVLSMIPFTAPMSMIMRSGLTAVPLSQVILSLSIMLATLVLFTWLSARIFRWGLLMYGKKITVFSLLKVLRGGNGNNTIVNERSVAEEVKS